ncbi:MAG: hypothetical protein Devi2KO_33730 [Devosia indica]
MHFRPLAAGQPREFAVGWREETPDLVATPRTLDLSRRPLRTRLHLIPTAHHKAEGRCAGIHVDARIGMVVARALGFSIAAGTHP